MDEQGWARVVAAATRAPSIHNTQPWLFVAGPDSLDVFHDPSRGLPVLDPTGRQQVISCAIAVEFAVVALAAAGHRAVVGPLPDVRNAEHLARVRVTGPCDPTDDDAALLDAIGRRHTVRAPFAQRAVPEEEVRRLAAEADRFDVWVKRISREEEAVATAFLISRAEEIERGEPDYLQELQRWVRTDPNALDGVPVGAAVEEDPATRPSNWLIRDFIVGTREPHTFLPPEDPNAPPPTVERPAVLVTGTENDDRSAWLQSGRALARMLLRLTIDGLAASPLTQALDWPATRTQLRSRLSLVGHPQMLMRMGYLDAGVPVVASGRRPVAEVLRWSGG